MTFPVGRSISFFLTLAGLLFEGCATMKPPGNPPEARYPNADLIFEKPSSLTALSASPYSRLKSKIDSLIPDSLFPPASIGIKIVSLKTKETLYELNAHSLFNPASNQKLYTSAAALDRLGEEFPLVTSARIDASTNTIFLKGFGDPVFSTANLDSLAKLVRKILPLGKTWRVMGDVSYFDNEYWGYGWNWDDEPESYAMFLTPLILNGNTIRLHAKPGRNVGDTLVTFTEPPTGYVTIENRGKTVADSITSPLKLWRKWRERLNVLTVEGDLRLNDTSGDYYDLSVWQPERYTVQLFAELLRKRGVIVYETGIDTVSSGATLLANFSHPLDSVVTYMNKVSDNLSGETLLKVLAAEKRGRPGSAEVGATVVKEFLAENGVDTTLLRIADGSGLSRMDLTSPANTIRLLESMYASRHFKAFYYSLPIAGVDGTNKNRMKHTPAEGNLRAKTGTLTAVTAFSGYAQTAEGEWVAFSMMMSNYVKPSRLYRQVQDRIGIFLSQLQREKF